MTTTVYYDDVIDLYVQGYKSESIQKKLNLTHTQAWESIDKFYASITKEEHKRIVMLYLEYNNTLEDIASITKSTINTMSYTLNSYGIIPSAVRKVRYQERLNKYNYLPENKLDRKILYFYKRGYSIKYIAHISNTTTEYVQDVIDTFYEYVKQEHSQIIRLYIDDKQTMRSIAKQYNCSQTTINKILSWYDIGKKNLMPLTDYLSLPNR